MHKNAFIQAFVVAGLIASAPFAQAAGNLVYCSEGSPAGFDPGLYTTGTDFDAGAETVFNRLSQFERGGTSVIPGLAEKWDISDDGTPLPTTFLLHAPASTRWRQHMAFLSTRPGLPVARTS